MPGKHIAGHNVVLLVGQNERKRKPDVREDSSDDESSIKRQYTRTFHSYVIFCYGLYIRSDHTIRVRNNMYYPS